MKPHRYIFLLPFILLLFASCAKQNPPSYEVLDEPTHHPVVRVVDGDTFIAKMDGEDIRVRLVGVDTPETVHPNKDIEYFGKEASDFLKELLEGEAVYFTYDQNNASTEHKDRYGRLLAYAFRAKDALFVNAEIIKQGYGFAYLKYPCELAEEFLTYQQRAREEGLGLWAEREDDIEDEADAVWVNVGSKKYHLKSCRYISEKSLEISRSEAIAQGMEACKVCKP